MFKRKGVKGNGLNTYENLQQEEKSLFPKLADNIFFVQNSLVHTEDLIIHHLSETDTLFFIESLVDSKEISDKVLTRIMASDNEIICDIKITNLYEITNFLIEGYAIFISEGRTYAAAFNSAAQEKRAIQEPLSEKILKGSHEGFIENLETNILLVRKYIKNPKLMVRYMTLGERSRTKVAVIYIEDLANDDIINELFRRLSYAKVDYIQSPGHIQEFIEDETYSPFPQMLNTERPDRVVANLMEGRFAIIADGSPTAMIAPINFFAFIQTPDDYNNRWLIGSFLTLFRVMSLMIAIGLPSLYIAVVSFHYEIIPFELVLALKGTLEFVPVPPIVEAVSMLIILELLSEAATRLPSPIAQTIGVVGGLVIGTAVVEANLVSNSMVVVVALTAVASYALPITEMGTTIRLLSFPLMVASSLFGLVGIVFGLMVILLHLCKLESFGTPYFTPLAPFRLSENKDTIIRLPLGQFIKRPSGPRPKDSVRTGHPRGWKRDE
ncbi:spore germination protein [Solibacillus sp. R5-41]|uniref:spore germination protein n=1 Tax=Solibacillus sp. R5-41 TaxID=2048654 RepID=UPI000C12762A|nr:spore germination protein [Solibacillus sp. R5-41]ATP41383.1 spore germination protein [Solibacillus sp. R5-41]